MINHISYKTIALPSTVITFQVLPTELIAMVVTQLAQTYKTDINSPIFSKILRLREVNKQFCDLIDTMKMKHLFPEQSFKKSITLKQWLYFTHICKEASIPIPPLHLFQVGNFSQVYSDAYLALQTHMKGKEINHWVIDTHSTKINADNHYVNLNTTPPSIFGIINRKGQFLVGAIKELPKEPNSFIAGRIVSFETQSPNKSNISIYGAKIDVKGHLLSGKISKKRIETSDRTVTEWHDCDIFKNGRVVPQIINKLLIIYPNKPMNEFHGCTIDNKGQISPGKISKKITRYSDGTVKIWHRCTVDDLGNPVNLLTLRNQ